MRCIGEGLLYSLDCFGIIQLLYTFQNPIQCSKSSTYSNNVKMVATFTIVFNSEIGPFPKETRVQELSLDSPIKKNPPAIGGCHSGFAAHGHYVEWLLCQ